MTKTFLVIITTILFFGCMMAACARDADAHYPSRAYAIQRVLDTNFGGQCGRGTLTFCGVKRADCTTTFDAHYRHCSGNYTEHGARNRQCTWSGWVTGDGIVGTILPLQCY